MESQCNKPLAYAALVTFALGAAALKASSRLLPTQPGIIGAAIGGIGMYTGVVTARRSRCTPKDIPLLGPIFPRAKDLQYGIL